MRPSQKGRSQKDNYKHKITKKKSTKKSTPKWNFYKDSTVKNLEDINEAFRMNKLSRTVGSWKLVPKDSCEVYKERRKRNSENQRSQYDRNMSEGSYNSRRRAPKGRRKNNKKRKRRHSDSSVPSYTCSEYSTSPSTASTSDSDMDYENY